MDIGGKVAFDLRDGEVIIRRDEPAFYCIPAKTYEAMMDLIEDKELLALAKSRMDEESIKVSE